MSVHRAAVVLFISLSFGWAAGPGNAVHAASLDSTGETLTESSTVDAAALEAVESAASGTSAIPSCTGTSGALTLRASTVRTSGVSPLLVFFDATGTTDSSMGTKGTTFQDVFYSWNFGDYGASGTDTWAYGSRPNYNTRNTATGGVAAHLFVTAGASTPYVVTVTAHNGANTVSCQLQVTAFDPVTASGFPGANTTCVSASGKPAAGSGGCPAGAATVETSSFKTALGATYFGSGKRVLFKCGDTFTGDNATLTGIKWSVGAYGGCGGTQTHRPILRDSGTNGELLVALASGDGRIADLDLEGNGTAASGVNTPGGNSRITYQVTLYNLYSNGNNSSFSWSQGAQWGLIDSAMTGMRTNIGTFVNYNENNPATWSGNTVNNLNYQALLGNSFNGKGATSGSGQETVRISACRGCVIENNTFENANNIGAVLKLHNGNTNNSSSSWTGVYTEIIEISDNAFGGTSGAQLVENAPQNAGDDERLRNIVLERNLFFASTGAQGGRQLLVSAVDETVRDNVFYMPGTSAKYPAYGVQVAKRGVEPVPSGVEVYNNTCYAPTAVGGETCVGFDGDSMSAPAVNSIAKNNLFYLSAAGHSTVVNKGTGNTISNNSASPNGNPRFMNASGAFDVITDFKPTTNYTGATSVPVWTDALGVLWSSAWELGAVHP
jgi:hypothetical protein